MTTIDDLSITGNVCHRGQLARLSVPLISRIDGRLWQGGCIHGTRLPDDFRFVVSLYQDEEYEIGPETVRLALKMIDHDALPDLRQLHDIARIVNAFSLAGKTLVHCQAGLNRSGLVAGLALVLRGFPPIQAVDLLREARCPLVLCNETFERWLLAYGGAVQS